ncbi:MAG: DUF3822 family protein [Flavobacteriaceae bacterium]
MIKKETNNIDLEKKSEDFQRLSIQVGLNGLSFCVLDTLGKRLIHNKGVWFKEALNPILLEQELRKTLGDNRLDRRKFAEVLLIHQNTYFSWVPKSLFDASQLANYLKFNTRILANDELTHDVLGNFDLINVYAPFTNINGVIKELYGDFEHQHHSTLLVQSLLNKQEYPKETVCYVHVGPKQMDIIVINGKKLSLFNCFSHTSKEDFIYYLLFTFEQLKLDTENTRLMLFGTIEEDDELYTLCAEYLKKLSVIASPDSLLSYLGHEGESIDFTMLSPS